MSFLLNQLKNFNDNLNINRRKNITFEEVVMQLEQFNLICDPKFSNKTDEENKSLHIEDNKYEWNYCKYLYVENYDVFTDSKQDRRDIKKICIKIGDKFHTYFDKLNHH